jgi:hypothetical protein
MASREARRKLREADRVLGEGKTVAEAVKALEISEQTFTAGETGAEG